MLTSGATRVCAAVCPNKRRHTQAHAHARRCCCCCCCCLWSGHKPSKCSLVCLSFHGNCGMLLLLHIHALTCVLLCTSMCVCVNEWHCRTSIAFRVQSARSCGSLRSLTHFLPSALPPLLPSLLAYLLYPYTSLLCCCSTTFALLFRKLFPFMHSAYVHVCVCALSNNFG